MIGVVSHAGDPHAIAVLNHLRSTGADVVLLDTADLPSPWARTNNPDPPGRRGGCG